MRVGILCLMQESNTFLNRKTEFHHFQEDLFLEGHIGLVVDAQPFFFLDHFALGFHSFVVDLGMEHAFRFQPQSEFQSVGWEDLEVEGPVLAGIGIQCTSIGLNDLGIFSATDIFTPFEEQVLKEVSKTSTPFDLILGAHMVEYGHRSDRRGVVLMKNEQDHDQYGDDQRPSGRGGIRLLGHRIQACQEEWGGKPSSANHWVACRVDAV